MIQRLGQRWSDVCFEGPWGRVEGKLPLVGRYNVLNMLLAVAAAGRVADVSGCLAGAIKGCPGVPGRLERVEAEGEGPTVWVDYAHTHDALENVLGALGPVTEGRLTVVFGCGGDRDRSKRSKMAGVACRLADRVVVTSDNPRTESPEGIIAEVMAGVPEGAMDRVLVEVDRGRAIGLAISGSGVEDTVLLAGKGHEDYQIIGTRRRRFDDRERAREALRGWAGRAVV